MANLVPAQFNAPVVLSGEVLPPDVKLKRSLRAGMITVAVLVFGLGGLAATIPITGAVIAPGEVGVESHIKQIAHPTGGVVEAILVKEGETVRKGQVLMKLDTRVAGANAVYTGENVDQLLARAARLRAERDSAATISFPAELTKRANDPNIAMLMSEELKNFQLKRTAIHGQRAQLSQRISQAQNQISGYQAQARAYDRQSQLVNEELDATRKLYDAHYTTLEKLNSLERAAVGVQASATGARSSINEAQARIAEFSAQSDSIGRESRSQAATELMDVESKIAELRRMKVTADDSLDRSSITAPQDGVVAKLAYNTIGGVIPAGQTIMEVVPNSDQIIVKVRVSLADIDQIQVGQPAALRFSAFSARTTPEIDGHVTIVAADRTTEERTGMAYYVATIAVPGSEIRKLGSVKLVAGMPVEAFIQSAPRTLMNFITKPLSDQLRRAFRQN